MWPSILISFKLTVNKKAFICKFFEYQSEKHSDVQINFLSLQICRGQN
jgi:hypothetical protein